MGVLGPIRMGRVPAGGIEGAVIESYIGTTEAAEILNRDASQVRRYCLHGRLRSAVKDYGGRWLIKAREVKRVAERPPEWMRNTKG